MVQYVQCSLYHVVHQPSAYCCHGTAVAGTMAGRCLFSHLQKQVFQSAPPELTLTEGHAPPHRGHLAMDVCGPVDA